MTMLTDEVDVVIGVDTHKHTHTAAVVLTATGASVDERTLRADSDGYQDLLELAQPHGTLRAWAIEGTGGYGAGFTRYLVERGERVIQLDRPNRAHRRDGAKSDPLDSMRAAREASARDQLAEPRATGQRAAPSVLLAARRSAVDAGKVAQHSCTPWWWRRPNRCGPSFAPRPPPRCSASVLVYGSMADGISRLGPPPRC